MELSNQSPRPKKKRLKRRRRRRRKAKQLTKNADQIWQVSKNTRMNWFLTETTEILWLLYFDIIYNHETIPFFTSILMFSPKQSTKGQICWKENKGSQKVAHNSQATKWGEQRTYSSFSTDHSHHPGTCRMKIQGNVNLPPICVLPAGGLMATQSSDIVIAISPAQTKTIVGVLPLLPINPFAKGYMCANTQQLKKTPPSSRLHCGRGL